MSTFFFWRGLFQMGKVFSFAQARLAHVLFPCDGCDIMSDSMDIYFFSPWGPSQNDDDNASHATRAEHKLCQPTTRQQNVMNEAPDVQ